MVTKSGIIKKTSIIEYQNIRKGGLNAINLRDEDELIQVKILKMMKRSLLERKRTRYIVLRKRCKNCWKKCYWSKSNEHK